MGSYRILEENRFNQSYVRALNNQSTSIEKMTFSDSMSFWLLGSCFKFNFTQFQSCATEIMNNMDLIIPQENFDESMIILHKLSCLPLSDFAYIEMKQTKMNFTLSDANLRKVLEFRQRDTWFERKARKKFETFFQTFQAEHCTSPNCSVEVDELRDESIKLKKACGIVHQLRGRLLQFSFDREKLQDPKLALRCLSFSLSNSNLILIDQYNDMLRHTLDNENFADRLSTRWMESLKNLTQALF